MLIFLELAKISLKMLHTLLKYLGKTTWGHFDPGNLRFIGSKFKSGSWDLTKLFSLSLR